MQHYKVTIYLYPVCSWFYVSVYTVDSKTLMTKKKKITMYFYRGSRHGRHACILPLVWKSWENGNIFSKDVSGCCVVFRPVQTNALNQRSPWNTAGPL